MLWSLSLDTVTVTGEGEDPPGAGDGEDPAGEGAGEDPLVCVTSVPVICSTAQQAVRFGTDSSWEGGALSTASGGLTGVQACVSPITL